MDTWKARGLAGGLLALRVLMGAPTIRAARGLNR